MNILCDEMLKGLARWLRAAGHDTEIANNGDEDRDLLARARVSGRTLVTRDRKLLEHRGAQNHVCLLECNNLETCALDLANQTGLDWQYQPFTRCLLCNTPLTTLQDRHRNDIPADVMHKPLSYCPKCDRVYWEGAHVRRMRKRLQHWDELSKREAWQA